MFLCYDPAAGEPFARRFGTLLARFGRQRFGPPDRRAVLRVRGTGPEADHLPGSAWFVLLASPAAARSPRVAHEVTRWLELHGTDRLLIGLTDGPDIAWADGRPAGGTETLPPALLDRLTTEPKWVDLRDVARLGRRDPAEIDPDNALVSEALATFAARLRGVEKDALIGVHVQRERRTRLLTWYGLATLGVLFGATLVFGSTTLAAYLRANAEARAADARLLAATALAVSDTDAERAVLLAAEGYRLHRDNQTFTALLHSIEATGPLGRRVDLDGDVVALAAAPRSVHDETEDEADDDAEDNADDDADDDADDEPGIVVAGTSEGAVWRWRLDQEPELLTTFDDAVTEVAVSADGRTVAAVAGGRLWVTGPSAGSGPTGPAGGSASDGTARLTGVVDVALDPDGERLAVMVWDDEAHRLLVQDVTGRGEPESADLTGTSLETVALTGDAVVVAQRRVTAGTGHWQRRTVPGLEVEREAGVVEPVGGELVDHLVSPDGAWVSAVRSGSVVAVGTSRNALYETGAPASLGSLLPAAVATSDDDAARMLLSRRDETWVVELPVWHDPQAWALRGMPTADAAAFLDAERLVTAHGATLASWDLTAAPPLTRSVEREETVMVDTALSPDGTLLATAGATTLAPGEGIYDVAASFDLDATAGRGNARPVFRAVRPGQIGDRLLPVPLDDGRVLVVTPEDGSVGEATAGLTDADLTSPMPLRPLEPRFETGLRSVRAARVVDDRLVLADGYGRVQVRDLETGELVHRGTASHTPTSEPWAVEAAVSPDGRYVAFHDLAPIPGTAQEATISVLDLDQSATRTLTVPAQQNITHLGLRTPASVLDLTYGDGKLLAAQVDGVLVIAPDGSAVRAEITSAAGSTGAFTASALAPVPGTDLVARAGELDWIRLYDTRTGQPVGSLSPPDTGNTLAQLWLGAAPGSLLAVSGYETVLWDLRPRSLVTAACGFAGRDLTEAEWTRTVGSAAPGDLTCDRDL
ncbi:hypothetical protein [Promicromonospora sp. NPDC057488]|uniref:hypothetical protein n=1 Tax=Promicromonospora sp. NPDC057488 TaxID=3346147 RepID=UPI00366A91D0